MIGIKHVSLFKSFNSGVDRGLVQAYVKYEFYTLIFDIRVHKHIIPTVLLRDILVLRLLMLLIPRLQGTWTPMCRERHNH